MDEPEKIQFIDLAEKMNYRFFDCYEEYYNPPFWIKKPELKDAIWKYKNETTVYYDDADNHATVEELIYKREPTNIRLVQPYNKKLLKEYYGYEESPYTGGSPNLSIYCKALCYPSDNKYPTTSAKIDSAPKYISVISVIAPALDSDKQPDHIVLQKIRTENAKIKAYKAMLLKAFTKISACYEDKKFTTLLMTGIGMGAFLSEAESVGITYEDAYDQYIACCVEVFAPIFKNKTEHTLIFNLTNKLNSKIPIVPQEKCREIAGDTGNVNLENIFISNYIESKSQAELDKTLIVNAWDPYSVVGNGNFADGSIDGYIGRISAVSVVTWPLPEFDLEITYTVCTGL